jgi:hypothetical protein
MMMGEPKPLASLSSGLLARKGAARPAMRRQPLGSGMATDHTGQDDLGWNDMGYDVDPAENSEMTRMVDLKPLLTNSLPHGGQGGASAAPVEHMETPQAATPIWYSAGEADDDDDDGYDDDVQPMRSPLSVKPTVVKQQEALAERVAAPPAVEAPVATYAAPEPEAAYVPEAVYEPAPAPAAVTVAAAVPQAPIRRAPRSASAPKAREKAAFTLRLDAERHLRLRLASAVNHRSAQLIMIDLLDDYLASLPEIDAMASRLPAAKANRL